MSSHNSLPFANTNIVYLDYNGTTPIAPEVSNAMWPYLTTHFGNASSSHHYGQQPKKAIALARKRLSNLLKVAPDTLTFTSGSTEAINHIIRSVCLNNIQHTKLKQHIICSTIEHPAVMNCYKYLQSLHQWFEVSFIACNKYGMIEPSTLKNALQENTIFVSIMHANNEIGTINPISDLVKIVKNFNSNILFHSDTSQSIGKIEVYPTLNMSDIDFITVAGHKMYGPKGIGAIYCKSGLKLQSFMRGASQENGRRPGTENVAFIVGLGKAAQLCSEMNINSVIAEYKYLRDLLLQIIVENVDEKWRMNIGVNGHPYQRLPNTLSIYFKYLFNGDINDRISAYIACSTGAACHSENIQISSVLSAMKVDVELAKGTLRLTVGRYTSEEDVKKAALVISRTVNDLYFKRSQNESSMKAKL